MTVRLRGHHLLCMITYAGVGYTEKFARNFEAVVARIAAREDIEIVEGPDDVCDAWIADPGSSEPHCHLRRIGRRDRLALEAVGELLGQPLRAGSTLALSTELLQELRLGFSNGTLRRACAKCQWEDTCTAASAAGFAGSLLEMRQPFAPDRPVGPPGRERIG